MLTTGLYESSAAILLVDVINGQRKSAPGVVAVVYDVETGSEREERERGRGCRLPSGSRCSVSYSDYTAFQRAKAAASGARGAYIRKREGTNPCLQSACA